MRLLRVAADRRTIAVICVWAGLVSAQWLTTPALWLQAVLLVATCIAAFLGAVIAHNALHTPVFVAPALNSAFQVVLSLIYGHPVSAYVPGHNLSHHRYTQTSRDVIRTSKAPFRWHLLNLFFFVPAVSGDIMREELRFIRAARHTDRAWYRQFWIETAVWLSVSCSLIWLDWRRFVLSMVLPGMYASWGILTMNLLQHDGCDADSEYNHSRNFVGRAVNWWTFNNGYHTVHHMNPGEHWSLLPAEHERLVAPHIHPALAQKSMLKFLFETYVWPGERRRYDGTLLQPLSPGADEDWIGDAAAWLRQNPKA
jgi:fatty acid desaturase